MKRSILLTLATLSACTVLFVGLMLVGVRLLTAEQIEARLENLLAAQVSIDSQINIDVFPSPAVRMNDVRIYPKVGRIQDAELLARPLISADSMRLSLNLASLLTGQFKPEKIVVVKPEILIDRAAGGLSSWGHLELLDFFRLHEKSLAPQGNRRPSMQSPDAVFRQIELVEAKVLIRNDLSGYHGQIVLPRLSIFPDVVSNKLAFGGEFVIGPWRFSGDGLITVGNDNLSMDTRRLSGVWDLYNSVTGLKIHGLRLNGELSDRFLEQLSVTPEENWRIAIERLEHPILKELPGSATSTPYLSAVADQVTFQAGNLDLDAVAVAIHGGGAQPFEARGRLMMQWADDGREVEARLMAQDQSLDLGLIEEWISNQRSFVTQASAMTGNTAIKLDFIVADAVSKESDGGVWNAELAARLNRRGLVVEHFNAEQVSNDGQIILTSLKEGRGQILPNESSQWNFQLTATQENTAYLLALLPELAVLIPNEEIGFEFAGSVSAGLSDTRSTTLREGTLRFRDGVEFDLHWSGSDGAKVVTFKTSSLNFDWLPDVTSVLAPTNEPNTDDRGQFLTLLRRLAAQSLQRGYLLGADQLIFTVEDAKLGTTHLGEILIATEKQASVALTVSKSLSASPILDAATNSPLKIVYLANPSLTVGEADYQLVLRSDRETVDWSKTPITLRSLLTPFGGLARLFSTTETSGAGSAQRLERGITDFTLTKRGEGDDGRLGQLQGSVGLDGVNLTASRFAALSIFPDLRHLSIDANVDRLDQNQLDFTAHGMGWQAGGEINLNNSNINLSADRLELRQLVRVLTSAEFSRAIPLQGRVDLAIAVEHLSADNQALIAKDVELIGYVDGLNLQIEQVLLTLPSGEKFSARGGLDFANAITGAIDFEWFPTDRELNFGPFGISVGSQPIGGRLRVRGLTAESTLDEIDLSLNFQNHEVLVESREVAALPRWHDLLTSDDGRQFAQLIEKQLFERAYQLTGSLEFRSGVWRTPISGLQLFEPGAERASAHLSGSYDQSTQTLNGSVEVDATDSLAILYTSGSMAEPDLGLRGAYFWR